MGVYVRDLAYRAVIEHASSVPGYKCKSNDEIFPIEVLTELIKIVLLEVKISQ